VFSLISGLPSSLPKNTSGVLRPEKQEDLYDTVSMRVFQDYSDMDNARFRLLAAN
jgi:hypothetical protein